MVLFGWGFSMDDALNGCSPKLESLRKREAALKAAIAVEQIRQQKRKARERERLVAVVGETILQQAARVPDFELLMKQTLKTAVTDEKTRKFLAETGWL